MITGDRVRAKSHNLNNGAQSDQRMLIDTQNPTGYSQVLLVSAGTAKTFYTLGLDVISQSESALQTKRDLLYDPHGSTRALISTNPGTGAPDINNGYFWTYDAYGNAIESVNIESTNLRFAGEWTDATGTQHLRARGYEPLTGTFLTSDPYSGDISNPQSLHKYLYAHGDPVNGVDPTGMIFGAAGVGVSIAVGAFIGGGISSALGGSFIEGAVLGAFGGGLGSVSFAVLAELFGTGTLSAYLFASGASGFISGGTTGGVLSYINGGDALDIVIDVLEAGAFGAVLGVGFGYAFAPRAGAGQWRPVNEFMSPRARAYQTQVTGRTGEAYIVNGTKCDGIGAKGLIDTKGPGYASFIKGGKFPAWFEGKKALIDQAGRQIAAANGTPITWHVAEAEAAAVIQGTLRAEGLTAIKVVHTPVLP